MSRSGALAIVACLCGVAASPALAAPVVIPGERATTAVAAPPDPPERPTTTPKATAAPSARPEPTYAEPLASLGARSPSCDASIGPRARRNCARTGSVAHAYPVSSYGFDVQVGFSITDLGDSFLGALQSIAALIWMALVYLVKGVLLLLEWAFSFDLLGAAMGDLRGTLDMLHRNVIGQPWFLAALSVTAVWGIWRGLVQRQTSQTITGLAATVGLMVAGLVILANPAGTVGYASRLANDASLGVLSAATGGPIDRPIDSLSQAMAGLFDQTVRDPWCALEFGSVDYCAERATGSRTLTNADVWLAYPAQSRGRKGLYRLLKGEDADGGDRPGLVDALTGPVGGAALDLVGIGDGEDSKLPDEVRARVAKAPERAVMQEAGGTFPRFALLALIAVGMTGAVALLAYIGIKLLLASMLALILLLFTPVVLLAPAFGEAGRATFVAWAKRLAGALAAKLIYALFLALVLAAAGTVARLDIGWFGVWLVQIAFWWGVLIKRQELLGIASAGTTRTLGGDGHGSILSGAYHAAQLGWMGSRIGRRAAAPVMGAAGSGRRVVGERREARTAAISGLAGERLDQRAEHALSARHAVAQGGVAERGQLERELRVIDKQLVPYDAKHAAARAERSDAPTPDAVEAPLVNRRGEVLKRLDDPELTNAEQITRRAATNVAQSGAAVTGRDVAAYRETRRRELAADLPLDDDRHLRAAGVDPKLYRESSEPERVLIRAGVERHLVDERRLLAAEEGSRAIHFDPATVRRRSAEERARLRAERRARQGRLGAGQR